MANKNRGLLNKVFGIFNREETTAEDKFVYFWDDVDDFDMAEEVATSKKTTSNKVEMYIIMAVISGLFAVISSSRFIGNASLSILGLVVFLISLYLLNSNFRNNYKEPMQVVSEYVTKFHEKDLREIPSLITTSDNTLIDRIEDVRHNLHLTTSTLNENTLDSFNHLVSSIHNIENTRDILDRLFLQLAESEGSTSDYRASQSHINQISESLDHFTSVFDEALLSIDNVTAAVKSIGKQTGMLALNAGIEAARAGELGIGFEVVSTNLRRLAQHAISTTNEIKQSRKEISEKAKDDLESITRAMQLLTGTIDNSFRAISTIHSDIEQSKLYLEDAGEDNSKLQATLNESGETISEYKI